MALELYCSLRCGFAALMMTKEQTIVSGTKASGVQPSSASDRLPTHGIEPT